MLYLPRCSVGGTRCRSASAEAGKFYWGSVLHKSEWALQMSRASPQFLTKVFYFRSRGLNGRLDPTIRRLVSWQAKEDSLKNAVIRTGSTAEEQDRARGAELISSPTERERVAGTLATKSNSQMNVCHCFHGSQIGQDPGAS
jgi:hypothetical protein